jgi:mannosyltransferase OCH1-like enzyme
MLGEHFFAAFTSHHYAMFSKEVTPDGFDFGYTKLHADFWTSGGQDFSKATQFHLSKLSVRPPDPAFRIPRLLVFAYERDLMMFQDPVPVFFNVWNTAETYKKAWNVSKVDTWFVDSFTCLSVIYSAKAELVPYYRSETNSARKTAVCNVAAMYLSGGFYFDVDLEVGAPYAPTDDVSLVVARDGDSLSSQFMACEPRSSVMEMTLEKMLDSYKRNQTHPDFELGSSLEESIATLKGTMQHETVPLKVIGGESMPWIPPSLSIPADSFRNPIPLDMLDPPSPDFKIPRRLIFTYKSNLLETKDPLIFYDNVQKTIKMYREAWSEPDAPVWFLDDDDCRSALYAAKPNLVAHFDREPKGSWKADICRVAALYLTGGYYFDVDMEAVNPWIANHNVTFATVDMPDTSSFFQSFMASEKEGRVLEEALDEMLLFYENLKIRTESFIGPNTLGWAFESVAPSERGETVILEEGRFSLEDAELQSRREAVGCCCQYEVLEPAKNRTIFYSRIVGAGPNCMDPKSPEGQAYVEAQEKEKKENERFSIGELNKKRGK